MNNWKKCLSFFLFLMVAGGLANVWADGDDVWWSVAFSDEGDACFDGLFIAPSDIDSALEYCEENFANGDVHSGYLLGAYYHQLGNNEKALAYYRQSAQQGHTEALFTLGKIYISAKGAKKDWNTGIRYIKMAAEQGYGRAQWLYAHIHDRVREVERNLGLAWKYYNRAAGNGSDAAMMVIGRVYLYGDDYGGVGNCLKRPAMYKYPSLEASVSMDNYQRDSYASLQVACDEEKGLQYFRQAAQVGSMGAMISLAEFYHYVKQDDKQAAYWLRQIVEYRHPLPGYEEDMHSPSIVADAQEMLKSLDIDMEDVPKVSEADIFLARKVICSYNDYSWHEVCRQTGE